jgi:RimJ/RimL family protein N-acetyltransferase
VEDGDIAILHAFEHEPGAAEMAAFPPREREAFEAHWARVRADETCVARTILVDGEVAGNIGSFDRDGAREVGYWIGRDYWGRGVATAALALFLEEVEPQRPIGAGVALGNAASMRVLEKCGFRRVGEDDGYVLFELA